MSDTGFDRQRITAGTELILSLPAPLPPASLFTPTRGRMSSPPLDRSRCPGAKNILIS